MNTHRRKSHSPTFQQGQWTIVGSLVAIAILVAIAAVFLPRLLKPRPGPGEPTAIQMGQGAACSEYASQMNQAVAMYRSSHDDKPPTSIEQLKSAGVTDDIIHAPGCAFVITNGVVTETGRGMASPASSAAPVTLAPNPSAPVMLAPNTPAPAAAPAPGPPNMRTGPGGIRVPTGGGTSPEASGSE